MTGNNMMSDEALSQSSAARLARSLKPKSIAIIGMSTKPGSAGQVALSLLLDNEYSGEVYLVGRTPGTIRDRQVLTNIHDLPEGVDLAVLAVPAASVKETIAACVARKVGSAVIFAGGFAELGEAERGLQEEIGAIARAGNLSVMGPNCLGFTNYIDRVAIGFASARAIQQLPASVSRAIGIVAQSGGLGGHLLLAFGAKNCPVSYMISTGNEMDVGLGDLILALIEDKVTQIITVYAEAIRRPDLFLAAARQARRRGKVIVMLHSGRGERSREAARSHTGALTGDYALMQTLVTEAGVILVETMDELLDVSEILLHYPEPSKGALGVLTFSGAFCGIAHDMSDDLGIEIPPLTAETEAALKPQVPAFIPPRNPLDLGTQPIWQPELVYIGAKALLHDPKIGALAISIPMGAPAHSLAYFKHFAEVVKLSSKPMVITVLGDGAPIPQPTLDIAHAHNLIVMRSSDRMMRAMAKVLAHGNASPVLDSHDKGEAFSLPQMQAGLQPEYIGKEILRAIGVNVPQGALARSVDEALDIAKHIGGPVAMKAQAAALAHKTEAGAVLLNLFGEQAIRQAWDQLNANVRKAAPDLKLDGILVEAMSQKGVELVIGGRRDPLWGPVLLIGLGGIWVEALQDVRLLPAHASAARIIEELHKLQSAKLLQGFRGQKPVDFAAIAAAAQSVGRLMMQRPDIVEVDLNPVMAHAQGQGVSAVDALIVTAG